MPGYSHALTMPWTYSAESDERFQRILRINLVLCLLVGVAVSISSISSTAGSAKGTAAEARRMTVSRVSSTECTSSPTIMRTTCARTNEPSQAQGL